MGKVTLVVLVAAIALGVYWFWWSDQGANSPITAEGTVSVSGLSGLPGMPQLPGMQGPMKANFTVQAVPGKIRLASSFLGKQSSVVANFGKSKVYVLNESKKTYAMEEFTLVDMEKTEAVKKSELTWPRELKRTADWEYLGSGEKQWFCNKQTPSTAAGSSQAEISPLGGQAKIELWFTPETRLGRRYFGTLNKILRIEAIGGRKIPGLSGMMAVVPGAPKIAEKRPQFKYVNLDFFPIPMKAILSMAPMHVEMNVDRLSRKKIPKDVFEIPSGYKKVSLQEVLE